MDFSIIYKFFLALCKHKYDEIHCLNFIIHNFSKKKF